MTEQQKKEEQLLEQVPQQEPQGVLRYFQSKFNEESNSEED